MTDRTVEYWSKAKSYYWLIIGNVLPLLVSSL